MKEVHPKWSIAQLDMQAAFSLNNSNNWYSISWVSKHFSVWTKNICNARLMNLNIENKWYFHCMTSLYFLRGDCNSWSLFYFQYFLGSNPLRHSITVGIKQFLKRPERVQSWIYRHMTSKIRSTGFE